MAKRIVFNQISLDGYRVITIALGAGKSMFQGVTARLPLKLIAARTFQNGNLFLRYDPTCRTNKSFCSL